MKRKKILVILILLLLIFFSACDSKEKDDVDEKPVIYLYPTEETEVSVRLDYDGKLNFTYPEYNGEWKLIAYPDGTLFNKKDGKLYSYLFWEGSSSQKKDFSKGFVVKGEDTAAFLQETLEKIGLTPKEYNEFIVYWLPRMKNNKYNLIAFQRESYSKRVGLIVEPKPDSVLRVFMMFKALEDKVDIEPQQIKSFTRKGFTVIEWGGMEVK